MVLIINYTFDVFGFNLHNPESMSIRHRCHLKNDKKFTYLNCDLCNSTHGIMCNTIDYTRFEVQNTLTQNFRTFGMISIHSIETH